MSFAHRWMKHEACLREYAIVVLDRPPADLSFFLYLLVPKAHDRCRLFPDMPSWHRHLTAREKRFGSPLSHIVPSVIIVVGAAHDSQERVWPRKTPRQPRLTSSPLECTPPDSPAVSVIVEISLKVG